MKLTLLILFVSILLLIPGCGGRPSGDDLTRLMDAQRPRADWLRLEMVQAGGYYLQLNVQNKTLDLCHSGVVVAAYPFRELDETTTSLFWVRRQPSSTWLFSQWSEGALVPERIVARRAIIPQTDDDPAADAVAPRMEDIIPVPRAFRLRFGAAFILEFLLDEPIPGAVAEQIAERSAWESFKYGLSGGDSGTTILRISMAGETGAAFYRSCPASPTLIILP